MRWCVAVLFLLTVATPAAAQSTYVGASLVGDIARFSKIDFDDDFIGRAPSEPSLDGEALGFNVKVGRALGERWGVELEFGRSGEFENRSRPFAIPALPSVPTLPVPGGPTILPPPIPFDIEIETEHRYTNFAALLWRRQALGQRVELAYLGGVTFTRAEIEQNVRIDDDVLARFLSLAAPSYTTIEHGVGPAIGLEADIKFGDHAAMTTGVRAHGIVSGRNGWLIRPLVGLRWRF